jgi:hypothetical protein
MRENSMKNFLMVAVSGLILSGNAMADRVCKYQKFGLNGSDEICAEISSPTAKSTLIKIVTDVATFDPEIREGSRMAVAAALCKLYNLGESVFASMTIRDAPQAGFLGGGAILGGGVKKISAIDTIRCRNK